MGFVVDADERLPPELVREVRELLAGGPPPADAYRLASDIYFLGRLMRHCGGRRSKAVRLFRRECRYGEESVHESIRVPGGKVGDSVAACQHSYVSFARALGRETEPLHHAVGPRQASRRPPRHLAGHPVRPPWQFVQLYFGHGGFRDGVPGLIECLSSAVYTFLKYAKLWEAGRTKAETPICTSTPSGLPDGEHD